MKNLLHLCNTKKKHLFFGGAIALVMIPLTFGYFLGLSVQKNRYTNFLNGFKNIREDSDKYAFINPLIGGISPPSTDVGIYSDAKEDIFSYLKKEELKGNLYNYSFYFRDFGTAFWFGINESSDFFPASLFKLPIAIAVYKEAEDNPNFLKQQVVYTKDMAKLNDSIRTNSESILVVDRAYSVSELVSIMIINSDNGAKNLLLSVVDNAYLNKLFSIVSLTNPTQDKNKVYQISSRKYALFFRVLYGSSYLNEEHSEYILTLLSKSDFKNGIVAGLPEYIPVAHKFGTYEFEENINGVTTDTHQLHDCGIIYHPQKPYIFCFMTKGKDLESLYRIISHISKYMYDYQEADNKE